MFKRAKVVMLPTNKKAGLIINPSTGKIQFIDFDQDACFYKDVSFTCNHLYIIVEDEIKEGDWMISTKDVYYRDVNVNKDGIWIKKNTISKCQFTEGNRAKWKKIIATTDSSLKTTKEFLHGGYENGEIVPNASLEVLLPTLSQSFIQRFVDEYNKGNLITNVLVEYDGDWDEHHQGYYAETVIPKVSKDNTITIRKVKDSWSRDEVIALHKANCKRLTNAYTSSDIEWIEDNL